MDPQLTDILESAIGHQASDIHISAGERVYLRIDGKLRLLTEIDQELSSVRTAEMADSVLSTNQKTQLRERGSVDGAISLTAQARFRFNIFRRNGEICLAFRLLSDSIATLGELGLSDELYHIAGLKDGLVLVAGPTGSGKSTTIASFIDRVNRSREGHIITIEDPIEFLHRSQKCLVNQREIGTDVAQFSQALLDAMRQDPDVILVGELRDIDTIRTAITAAETGHLVFASVHAGDAKTAIERLVGSFSADEQNLAQRLIATVLRTIIVQHLLPVYESPNIPLSPERPRRVLASEILQVNSAASNIIANGNLQQMSVVIESGREEGMWTLDASLAKLWRSRLISEQTARSLARNPEMLGELSKRILRT